MQKISRVPRTYEQYVEAFSRFLAALEGHQISFPQGHQDISLQFFVIGGIHGIIAVLKAPLNGHMNNSMEIGGLLRFARFGQPFSKAKACFTMLQHLCHIPIAASTRAGTFAHLPSSLPNLRSSKATKMICAPKRL